MTSELPEAIASEARALFAELPAGEITEDEPLEFMAPRGSGSLIIRCRGAVYVRRDGAAWRYRRLATGRIEQAAWVAGQKVGRSIIGASLAGEIADLLGGP